MTDLKSPNTSEDSYDTREILQGLKKQRRRQHLVAAVGILILVVPLILGGWHLMNAKPQIVTKPTIPPTPTKRSPALATPPVAKTPAPAVVLPPPTTPAVPQPLATTESVHVRVKLSKAGSLWIDNQLVGVQKNYDLQLAVGEHRIKARFGRRVVEESFTVIPKKPLLISMHARRKHVRVTALK